MTILKDILTFKIKLILKLMSGKSIFISISKFKRENEVVY
jgi:hypothetical protein